jgi:hypothetical protein
MSISSCKIDVYEFAKSHANMAEIISGVLIPLLTDSPFPAL